MHGLYVVWWVQEKHVPVAAVAAILAAGDLALSALELPTGWVADRYGHRVSLISGSVFQVAGMLLAWLGTGVPGVLASSLVIAIGDALRSGADQALLFRSCVALGDGSFQRREAHTRALQLVALVVMVLAGGGIVGAFGFAVGWTLETLVALAGLLLACAMTEPPRADESTDAIEPSIEPLATRGDQSRADNRIGRLVAMVLPAAVLVATACAGLFVVQSAADTQPMGMTIVVAAATLAEAAGALASARVAPTWPTQIAIASIGLAALAVPVVLPGAVHPAVVVGFFTMGLIEPLRAAAIQRVAADRARARAASLASACDKVLATIALLIVGARRM